MAQKQPPLIIQRTGMTDVEPLKSVMNGGSSIACLAETHAEIHKGNAYAGGVAFSELASSASIFFVGQNNNVDKSLHIVASVSAGGDCEVSTIGGATGQTGGTPITSYNRKTGATDSNTLAWGEATAVTGGATVKTEFIAGGSGPLALGGSTSFRAERIIAPGAWVVIEIKNVSAQPYTGSFGWDFYLADVDETGY